MLRFGFRSAGLRRRLASFAPSACEYEGTLAQRTLVLHKPDAVQRGLVGEITTRIEAAPTSVLFTNP